MFKSHFSELSLEPMATLIFENYIPGIQNAAISDISVYFESPIPGIDKWMDMAVKMRLMEYLDTLRPYKNHSVAVAEDKVLSKGEYRFNLYSGV